MKSGEPIISLTFSTVSPQGGRVFCFQVNIGHNATLKEPVKQPKLTSPVCVVSTV